MDMELDLFTQETFHDEIASYLANDVLNVVHMISLDYIDMYDENELVQEVMKEADMVEFRFNGNGGSDERSDARSVDGCLPDC